MVQAIFPVVPYFFRKFHLNLRDALCTISCLKLKIHVGFEITVFQEW